MPKRSELHFPGIYKFTNKINGKVYVGQAGNIYKRLKHHRRMDTSSLFDNAKRKYGMDGFDFEVLERVDDLSIIDQREQYWMDFYQCYDKEKGYNICPVAGSTRGRKATARQIEVTRARGKAQVGEKNPFYGRKHTNEIREMISQMNTGRKATPEHRAKLVEIGKISQPKEKLARMTTLAMQKVIKQVAQIDPITGEVIRLWPNFKKIKEEISGVVEWKLRAICNGFYWGEGKQIPIKNGTYLGFNWQYASNHNKPIAPSINEVSIPEATCKKIVQIDPITNQTVKIWDSAQQIKRVLGIDASTINNTCRGGYRDARSNVWYQAKEIVGGFRWRRVTNDGTIIPQSLQIEQPEISRAKLAGIKRRKKVEQIDINTGKILRVWDSVNDINNELGLNADMIKNTCRGYYGTKKGRCPKTSHGGFKWRYTQ